MMFQIAMSELRRPTWFGQDQQINLREDLTMSFLDGGKSGGFRWIAAPLQRSISNTPGCAQCGSKLEMDAKGVFALSGKCDNCAHRVFDEDEITDELEY
jgi:hypothetical protein